MKLLYAGLFCLVFRALLTTPPNCGLSESEVNQLLHYQGWFDHWRGDRLVQAGFMQTGLLQTGNQEFKVFKDRTSWLIYSPTTRTVYKLSSDGVSMLTCWQEKDWLRCFQRIRESQTPSVSNALLGILIPGGSVASESICSFWLEVPSLRWNASPRSDQKGKIEEALASEITKSARHFGVVRKIVCNDFNVVDPEIWAIVNITDNKGRNSRLLVGVGVHQGDPVRIVTEVLREPTEEDEPLIRQVLQDQIELTPG